MGPHQGGQAMVFLGVDSRSTSEMTVSQQHPQGGSPPRLSLALLIPLPVSLLEMSPVCGAKPNDIQSHRKL